MYHNFFLIFKLANSKTKKLPKAIFTTSENYFILQSKIMCLIHIGNYYAYFDDSASKALRYDEIKNPEENIHVEAL